jgi:hypothetical protein
VAKSARPVGPITHKWGFGMAPIKPESLRDRLQHVKVVRDFIVGDEIGAKDGLLDSLSEVKGLFNRTVRSRPVGLVHDLGNAWLPDEVTARDGAIQIGELRSAVKVASGTDIARTRNALRDLGAIEYLNCFLEESASADHEGGFIYILSSPELPNMLKIGQTTRTPEVRTKEINSATGVIIPWGVRYAWRVSDPEGAERAIQKLLDRFRIRNDREAFQMDFFKASDLIRDYLRQAEE